MTDWDAETADWYATNFGEYATNRLAADAIELAPNTVLVDVGCGTASALRHVAARVPEGILIGVDPVPRMIEIARERLEGHAAADRIELRVGAAEALPVDDAFADVVFAFDSFDHWSDAATGLAEVRRILKPGGRLVVVKDAGVPWEPAERAAFERALEDGGFQTARTEQIERDEVAFTLWELT